MKINTLKSNVSHKSDLEKSTVSRKAKFSIVQFFVRGYLGLIFGLIAIVAISDYFYQQQSTSQDIDWIDRTLKLVKIQVEVQYQHQHQQKGKAEKIVKEAEVHSNTVVDSLFAKLGEDIKVSLAANMAFQIPTIDGEWVQLETETGEDIFVTYSSQLGQFIQVKFRTSIANSDHSQLTWLFYGLVLLYIGIWFWPLVRDLKLLSNTAHKLSNGFKTDLSNLSDLAKVKKLKNLALVLTSAIEKNQSLIQHQKQLASALSHEMRTPLAKMRFALEVLDKETFSDTAKKDLKDFALDVQELETLVDEMLKLARVDATLDEIKLESVKADDWLNAIVKQSNVFNLDVAITMLLNTRTVTDTVKLSIDPKIHAYIVSNLVSNASRHGNSKINLTANIAQVEHGAMFELVVEDDGAGIQEADINSIFQPFYSDHSQVHGKSRFSRNESRAEKGDETESGTGLGLTIVKSMIERLDGHIEVTKSEQLGGASFNVSWPLDH